MQQCGWLPVEQLPGEVLSSKQDRVPFGSRILVKSGFVSRSKWIKCSDFCYMWEIKTKCLFLLVLRSLRKFLFFWLLLVSPPLDKLLHRSEVLTTEKAFSLSCFMFYWHSLNRNTPSAFYLNSCIEYIHYQNIKTKEFKQLLRAY